MLIRAQQRAERREPRPRPIRGLVADLFCVKTRGVGRGDFFHLDLIDCMKYEIHTDVYPFVVPLLETVNRNLNLAMRNAKAR